MFYVHCFPPIWKKVFIAQRDHFSTLLCKQAWNTVRFSWNKVKMRFVSNLIKNLFWKSTRIFVLESSYRMNFHAYVCISCLQHTWQFVTELCLHRHVWPLWSSCCFGWWIHRSLSYQPSSSPALTPLWRGVHKNYIYFNLGMQSYN